MLFFKLAPVWACFLLCFLLARGAAARGKILADWRLSWAFAFLLTGTFVVGAAEIASAFNCLERPFLAALWLALDVVLGTVVWRKFRRETMDWASGIRQCFGRFSASDRATRWLYGSGLAFAVLLGVVSVQARPFVWDCKTYHVPRMLNWIQDKNLRHFPTSDIRRVAYDPGAEIASTTFYLLDGSDRSINLVSWFSVLTSAVLGSFLTEFLMGLADEKAGQERLRKKAVMAGALAFVLILTIPEGLFQAISTENDLVAAAWNLTLACMTVLFLRHEGNWFYAGGIGLSLALGICTKATTFISAAPFLTGAVALLLWRHQLRLVLAFVAILVVAVTLVNAPWFSRNDAAFGHFLGPASLSEISVNPSFTPDRCLANIFRNLSLYTATPSAALTGMLDKAFGGLIAATGRPADDPSSLFHYQDRQFTLHFLMPGRAETGNGDGVGNIHAWLIFCALFMIWRLPLRNALGFHAFCTAAGFCLSCSYLRWHPWMFRLHMTYFVLALPVVAATLAVVAHRAVTVVMGMGCVANALLILGLNSQYLIYTPFLHHTHEEQVFGSNMPLHPAEVALAEDIIQRGCTNVLLKCKMYSFDYGLWTCLWDRGYRGAIQEFMVDNETESLRRWQFNARTAMVFMGVRPPANPASFEWGGQHRHLLYVSYSYREIHALFSSPFSDHWWRLCGPDNRAELRLTLAGAEGIGPNKPVDVEFSCRVVDRDGQALSNNILHLISPQGTGDFDLRNGMVDAESIMTNGILEMQALLLKSLPPEKYPGYLSKLQLSWNWAGKAAGGNPARPATASGPRSGLNE